MSLHFTPAALTRLLSGPPNDAETARAIRHLYSCHRCWASAAEWLAQQQLDGNATLRTSDSRAALVALIKEESRGAKESLKALGLWAEIKGLGPAEQIKRIRSVSALQTLAVFEVIVSDARRTSLSDPYLGESIARIAFTLADLFPEPRFPADLKSDLRGEAMTVVANCRRIAADWPMSKEAIKEARRHLAEGTGDPGLEAKLLSIHSSLCADIGKLEESLSLVRRAGEIYRSLEDWNGVAHSAVKEANHLLAAYRPEEAIEKANFALPGIPSYELRLQVLARFVILESLVILERPLEALRYFMDWKPMFDQAGDLVTRLRAASVEARLLDGLGCVRESERLFRDAVNSYFEHELYKEAFITLLTLFECFCHRGALSKAAALCEAAIAATSQAGEKACNDQIRRAWEEMHAAVSVRQLSDSELAHARQFLIRNWSMPEAGAAVLPKVEAAIAKASVSSELPALPPTPAAEVLASGGYQAALDAYDRQLIGAVLDQTGGRIREASRRLGLSRNGLRAKIRRYGLTAEQGEKE